MSQHETAPSEFQGRLSKGKDWREIVAWVGDLPPMPQIAARAIQMVENPDTTAPELTELLSKDPTLAARVLKIANSAMFSRQREITTLTQAIMLIGFKALKGVIVAATLRQMNKSFGSMERLVWENSMCTASCATLLAERLRRRYVEEIFLLGLLHNLGQIVLLVQPDTQKEYKNVLNIVKTEGLDYAAAEQKYFGFSHPLIGALVAKKWNFSAETCQVILHYRDPVESLKPDTEVEEKTAVVRIADILAHTAGVGTPPGYPDQIPEAVENAKFVGFETADPERSLRDLVELSKAKTDSDRQLYE